VEDRKGPQRGDKDLAGPRGVGDTMFQDVETVHIPPRLRYDPHHHFRHFWHSIREINRSGGFPFDFKAAPAYPPDPVKELRGIVVSVPPNDNSAFGFYVPNTSPSVYDQTTKYQEALEQQIGDQQDRVGPDPRLAHDPRPPTD